LLSYSLKTKLIILITIIITSISLFVFIYFPQKFHETQLKAIDSKVNTIAQIATISVGSALFFNDLDALEEEISSLLKVDNVEYIVIKAINGPIVYEFNMPQALEKKYSSISDDPLSPDKFTFRVQKPIEFNDDEIGVLFLGYSLKELKKETSSIKDSIGLVSLAILIIGISFVILIGNYMTKPLTRMVETVKKIGDGDLSQRAQVISKDELGYLARSFNVMVESISVSKLKLEETNKEIESQLKFLKALLSTIPIPIYILDSKQSFTDYNPAFEKHFRKKKTDLLGKSFYSLFSEEDQKEFQKNKDQLLREGFLSFEKRLNYSPDLIKDLIFFESTFQSASGKTAGIVGVILDITEIKESERKTLSALSKEKELAELRTKFFSHASHEFRTPLTTIQSSVELISMLNPRLSVQENNPHVEQIFTSISYMQELLDDILTINKADTGKFIANPELLNLFEFINSLKEEIENNDRLNHQINLTCDNKNQTIVGDKKTLRLIFSNLITNSIKYSPSQSTINIKIYQSDSHIAIRITDNGIGIPKEEQNHIFEPFFRASNAGDVKGTGLGLSLVKKLVDQHKGTICFSSVPNKETEFIVSLPMNGESIKQESNQLEESYN
jgi:PAS domain S-box-containing protein